MTFCMADNINFKDEKYDVLYLMQLNHIFNIIASLRSRRIRDTPLLIKKRIFMTLMKSVLIINI